MDETTTELSTANRINLLRAGRRRWALRRTEELAAEHRTRVGEFSRDALDLFAEVAS